MEKILHRADSRGLADHGWLKSRHTFSFASYYNAERMRFGKLRVINDDVVAPSGGFATHGHDNMEIVSVPLSGALKHKDSMGNVHVIKHGEVQIMSAGTGITHSEYNDSDSAPVNFLQIWVLPKERDITPRYGQKNFDPVQCHNRFCTVISPDKNTDAIWINQDAYFTLGRFDAGQQVSYSVQRNGNGIYLFVIDGTVDAAGETLGKRDAIGVTGTTQLDMSVTASSQLLVIDVPMQ
jgi:redox-sensitive bicupin YhaK (pirin superfamily)